MGAGGSFKGLKPPTKLISGLYHQGSDYDLKTGERIDGICKHCEQWDAELVDGGCRDRECKEERLRKMVENGQAMRLTTGVLSKDGKQVTIAEHSGKRFLYERED